MKGTMLIVRPAGPAVLINLAGAVAIDALQAAVGGYIEAVPHLNTIEVDGDRRPCVAFCNENGKLEGMPFNPRATEIWRQSCGDSGGDWISGPLAILYGDQAFMAVLTGGDVDDIEPEGDAGELDKGEFEE